MNVEVESILAVNELLRADEGAREAYYELIDVLQECDAPRRDHPKSKPAYVFDQTALVELARSRLEALGWAREAPIHPASSLRGASLAPVKADMSKSRVHAIFEFGNRASYAYNTLSRYALGTVEPGFAITAFVVPTATFANRIDSNLATFERLVGEFNRLERLLPRMIPGPLLIVGVEPDRLDSDPFAANRNAKLAATLKAGPAEPAPSIEPPRPASRRVGRSAGPQCPVCGKRFKTSGGLDWHRRNIQACRE